MTLVSPASLGSRLFSSSITFMICYDQACSNQIPGRPVTQPVYYNIFLTQGIEFNLINASLASYAGGVTDRQSGNAPDFVGDERCGDKPAGASVSVGIILYRAHSHGPRRKILVGNHSGRARAFAILAASAATYASSFAASSLKIPG